MERRRPPMRYDALIVGAGLSGATCAAELRRAGKRVLVLERRAHIAGNAYDEVWGGQRVSRYGAHIFHTNSLEVWAFVQAFGDWTPVTHRKYAKVGGALYAFPINLMTLYQLWGVTTPSEARAELERRRSPQDAPQGSLEAWCLHHIGPELYELFVKGYTEKMWGRACADLPHTIIARIPVRTSYDDRYFSDRWEAVPTDGYTALVAAMLDGCEVLLDTDYLANRAKWDALADVTIYTGPIDALYGYQYGPLDYRSLRFGWSRTEGDHQGALTVNYPSASEARIRTEEYAHLWRGPGGWLCTSTPDAYDDPAKDALYPVRDAESLRRLAQYQALATSRTLVLGRLGAYQYLNMDQAIAAALKIVRLLCV